MFRLEQANGALFLLLQFKQALLETSALFKDEPCFSIDVDGADLVSVGVEFEERAVHLRFDVGQLLFQEFQSLLGFGVSLFYILAQVRRSDFVYDFCGAVGINVLVAEFQYAGFLAPFLDFESALKFCDSVQTV